MVSSLRFESLYKYKDNKAISETIMTNLATAYWSSKKFSKNYRKFNVKKLAEIIKLYSDDYNFVYGNSVGSIIQDANSWKYLFEYSPQDIIDCYDIIHKYLPLDIRISLYNNSNEAFKLFVEFKGLVNFFLDAEDNDLREHPQTIDPILVPKEVLDNMMYPTYDYTNMTFENLDEYTKIIHDNQVYSSILGYIEWRMNNVNINNYFSKVLEIIRENQNKKLSEYSLHEIKTLIYMFVSNLKNRKDSISFSAAYSYDKFDLELNIKHIGQLLIALNINELVSDDCSMNYFITPLKLLTRSNEIISIERVNKVLKHTEVILDRQHDKVYITLKKDTDNE